MRTTINIDEDALLVARQIAARERISLGGAISNLVRRGVIAPAQSASTSKDLIGRYALLPARDEVITPAHIRELMDGEGGG